MPSLTTSIAERLPTFPDAIRFLDFASERLWVRKVGGGYEFVHHRGLDRLAHDLADFPRGSMCYN
jgi:hypothetical protein